MLIRPVHLMRVLIELIDTLWNVNELSDLQTCIYLGINRYIMECKFFITVCNFTMSTELIDTLWNVNSNYKFKKIKTLRINRYIMECK